MKRLAIVALIVALASCGPTTSPADIESTVSARIKALPTYTPYPTYTPASPVEVTRIIVATNEPAPEQIATSVPDTKAIQSGVLNALVDWLKQHGDVKSVNLARINDGQIQIEVGLKWASEDRQPPISYDIISGFSEILIGAGVTEDKANLLTDGKPFAISLVTYSSSGDYRYQSITDYATLKKIYDKSISYDEWVTAAKAGFE